MSAASIPTTACAAGGAAGDFSTMSFEERALVRDLVESGPAAARRSAMGAQTTSTRERSSCEYCAAAPLRLHPGVVPIRLHPHRGTFCEYVAAAAEARYRIIVLTPSGPARASDRIAALLCRSRTCRLKWSTRAPRMESSDTISHFARRPRSAQQPAVHDEHRWRARSRFPLQLLAGMGIKRWTGFGARLAEVKRMMSRMHALPSCGSSRETTPAATAISTTGSCECCAGLPRSGRRPATCARSSGRCAAHDAQASGVPGSQEILPPRPEQERRPSTDAAKPR